MPWRDSISRPCLLTGTYLPISSEQSEPRQSPLFYQKPLGQYHDSPLCPSDRDFQEKGRGKRQGCSRHKRGKKSLIKEKDKRDKREREKRQKGKRKQTKAKETKEKEKRDKRERDKREREKRQKRKRQKRKRQKRKRQKRKRQKRKRQKRKRKKRKR
jgi:hypothetical protein